MIRRTTQRSRTRKILLSMAVLGCAASIAGLGTFASFTSTTSASQTVSSGTVVIALGATGASTNRLTVNATGVVPGDTMQRSFNIANTGSQNLASITLTTAATTSSLLDTDATDGLQMIIERCSVAWVEVGTSPAFTYTCAGTTSTVLATRAVVGSTLSLSNLTTTTAGNTDNLRLTLSLPSSAGNSFQGLSSTIQYSFTGTQRAGTNA
jgi:predicted ribosomally synthesized peptide with SipW-like signal peptide